MTGFQLIRPLIEKQEIIDASCCGLLVHNLADFNLHIPANAAWLAACAAIATSPTKAVGSSLRETNP